MTRDIQNLSADIKIASSTQFNRYEYESLQYIHDVLKERFIQTLANLCKNNEHKYIISSGITFDRTSREFNQDYVGLICNVSISYFSTCMPFSTQNGL